MKYKPVSCSIYDELELLSLRQEICLIGFMEEGVKTEVNDVIAEIFTENKAEYMRLGSGKIIRLDQIIQVNGKNPSADC